MRGVQIRAPGNRTVRPLEGILVGLFADIISPCLPVLARLEFRGMPVDQGLRQTFREETQQRLDHAAARIEELVAGHHARRVELVREAVTAIAARTEAAKQMGVAKCEKHPTYGGLTKRQKCPGCVEVYSLNVGVRATVKDLRSRLAKGRLKLKQIGPLFQVGNDNHWRWLLFDPDGLGLRPVAWTGKMKLPQVDDDAIEKLQHRHPDVELLRLRVETKKAHSRLTRALGMKKQEDGSWLSILDPDERGRLHFAYSAHRTGTGRLASGDDDDEDDKHRESEAGNAQNLTDKDRRMYVADRGMILLPPDWSQIEARVMAWLAREYAMLDAWARGEDIHAINGAALARALGVECAPAEADEKVLWFAGEERTFRYAAKRMTHGWDYGMGPDKTAAMYGLDISTAYRLIAAYFGRWRRLAEFQKEEYARALQQRHLRNEFGRVLRFWNFEMRQGVLILNDREEALAFRPQSDVGDMCKKVLPDVEFACARNGGELLTTTHDSFLPQVPDRPEVIERVAADLREIMECSWPQLGELPGYGLFRCPVEFGIGRNWGKHHPTENANGIKKWKPASAPLPPATALSAPPERGDASVALLAQAA